MATKFYVDRNPLSNDIIDLGMTEGDFIENRTLSKVWILTNGNFQTVAIPQGGSGETLICDRPPTANEPLEYGKVEKNCFWWDEQELKFYRNDDNTPADLKWSIVSTTPFNY